MHFYWYVFYFVLFFFIFIAVLSFLNKINMPSFYTSIIISVVFVLEVFFAYLLYVNGGINVPSYHYPPSSSTCPDYWQYMNNLCIIPGTNGKNVGSITEEQPTPIPFGYDAELRGINFRDPGWNSTGVSDVCAKQKWANTYNIWWNGITNVDLKC